MENKQLFRIHVKGRVQGIGFRYSAVREARIRGITGFVKNQYDGSVYIEAEGPQEQLLDYLEGNLELAQEYFTQKIPKIKVIKPQGTYLLWFDCRALGLDDMELRSFMRKKARVGLDDGFLFGAGGSGFERMNIGCPRGILQEVLHRIETAVNSL